MERSWGSTVLAVQVTLLAALFQPQRLITSILPKNHPPSAEMEPVGASLTEWGWGGANMVCSQPFNIPPVFGSVPHPILHASWDL